MLEKLCESLAIRGKKDIEHEKLGDKNPVNIDNIRSLSDEEFRLWTYLRFDSIDDKITLITRLLLIVLAAVIGTEVLL